MIPTEIYGIPVEPLDTPPPIPGDGEMAVYAAYSTDSELLYVGKTRNFQRRMRGHRSSSAWWEFVGVIRTVSGLTWKQAGDLEVTVIKVLQPPFNVAHNDAFYDVLNTRSA